MISELTLELQFAEPALAPTLHPIGTEPRRSHADRAVGEQAGHLFTLAQEFIRSDRLRPPPFAPQHSTVRYRSRLLSDTKAGGSRPPARC